MVRPNYALFSAKICFISQESNPTRRSESMRNVARLKMGDYPLPEAKGVKLRSLVSFAEPASVIGPCVGQGTALQLITSEAPVRRHGVELDAELARIASANGVETIRGNAFDANARPESFSLPCLNPPDDSEIGSIANRRMEAVFPTMAEVEQAMIVAVYEKSNRRHLEAARLLGIGKTTVYRKLRAMGDAADLDAHSCVRTFEDVDGGQAVHQIWRQTQPVNGEAFLQALQRAGRSRGIVPIQPLGQLADAPSPPWRPVSLLANTSHSDSRT